MEQGPKYAVLRRRRSGQRGLGRARGELVQCQRRMGAARHQTEARTQILRKLRFGVLF